MSDDGGASCVDRSGTLSADRTLQNSTVAPRSPAAESPAVKPLLECGGLTALVEMIRIQRLLHRAPTGSEAAAVALEGLLLRTLCAALAGSAAAQHSLRGAGGLEMLIEGIGVDATGTHDDDRPEVTEWDLNGGDTAGGGAQLSLEVLELGALALDAVRRAVRRNGQNVKRAIEGGAFGPVSYTHLTLPTKA